jgi:hypothetical protein
MQPEPCKCGLCYKDMKTGFTFYDIRRFLWSYDEDPSTWRHVSRGTVLGKWCELKRQMWDEHVRGCDEAAANSVHGYTSCVF